MRGTIGRTITIHNNLHITTKQTSFLVQSSFSTSSSDSGGGGGGRGRGRGGGASGGIGSASDSAQFDFSKAPGKPESDESRPKSADSRPSGFGHGRGRPISADPVLPGFSSFISSVKSAQTGAGRGRVTTETSPSQPEADSQPDSAQSKKPLFVRMQELDISRGEATEPTQSREAGLPSGILSVLSGAGRGKPTKQPEPGPQVIEENRHLRARPRPGPKEAAGTAASHSRPKLSPEEAVKNAVRMLSRGGGEARELEGSAGRGRGGRMGGRGRGRGRGRGMQREWRERGGERWEREPDAEESYGAGLYLGDNADGEKLAERLGPENMNKLVEGFEEMSGRVLPSPMADAYLDALQTNLAVRVLFCEVLLE